DRDVHRTELVLLADRPARDLWSSAGPVQPVDPHEGRLPPDAVRRSGNARPAARRILCVGDLNMLATANISSPTGYAGRTVTKPPEWHSLVVFDILFNNLSTGLFL